MDPATTLQWTIATVQVPAELADFDAVVHQHWPRVFRFALASLRDHNAAESLAQDCFLRAWQARERYRGEASVSTWLMHIAVNLVRDRIRNRRLQFWKRTQTMALDMDWVVRSVSDGRATPESEAAARQQIAAVWAALEELTEKQRTVFLLRFVEDMNALEIAAATGLKEGTVKTHLFRAMQAIRKKLGSK